jgi:hypothetical protein
MAWSIRHELSFEGGVGDDSWRIDWPDSVSWRLEKLLGRKWLDFVARVLAVSDRTRVSEEAGTWRV